MQMKARQTPRTSVQRVRVCTRQHLSAWTHACDGRKYADLVKLDPWSLFLQQSGHYCCNHKSVHEPPAALLQGWARFPCALTDCEDNWKRRSESSEQCLTHDSWSMLWTFAKDRNEIWMRKQTLQLSMKLLKSKGRKWSEVWATVRRFGGEKHFVVSLIPFHNTAARSPRWCHWAGRAGTKTRWCCQQCGWPGAWWILWMELQEAQARETDSQHRCFRHAQTHRIGSESQHDLPSPYAGREGLCHMILVD